MKNLCCSPCKQRSQPFVRGYFPQVGLLGLFVGWFESCDKGRGMLAWAAGHVQLGAAEFWVTSPQEEPLLLFFRLREIKNTLSASGPHMLN